MGALLAYDDVLVKYAIIGLAGMLIPVTQMEVLRCMTSAAGPYAVRCLH